jgi:solute carrier family 25 oxoglutarate transporter 11
MATSPAPPQDNKAAKPVSKAVIFASSGLGGMLGWCIVHPANTVAVRANLASMRGQKFSFKAMVKEHGWMSVYDGLSAGVMRQVFYASSRFGLFETFRDMLHEYRGKTDFASRYVQYSTMDQELYWVGCFNQKSTNASHSLVIYSNVP